MACFFLPGFLLQLRKAHPCLRQARFGIWFWMGETYYYWFKNENGVSLRQRCRCLHCESTSEIAMTTFFFFVTLAGGVLVRSPKRIRAAAGSASFEHCAMG